MRSLTSLPDVAMRRRDATRDCFSTLGPRRNRAAAPGASPPAARRQRSLARPRVALVIETTQASGREVLRGIARFAGERHAWAIFHEPGSTVELVRRLPQWRGDGIIACISNREVAAVVVAANVPVVHVLGPSSQAGLPVVDIDNEAIIKLAAGHLRQCGCQAFGFVGTCGAKGSRERCAAFTAEVGLNGAPIHTFQSEASALSCDAQQGELAKWLVRLSKPVGIMAADDPLGRHVLEAARRAGLSIPDEVAVIGVGNDEPICELADPPLSSVRPDYAQVGYCAAEILDGLMRAARSPRRTILLPPVEVVVRQSTDLAAVADADVVRAMRFIRQHACNGIRVEQVADEVHLSRSTLKRRFQAAMKRSVHDEILRVRLGRAQELLAQTDLPLDAIAERAGFRHQEYMGAVFRAKLGRTPAEFRRQRA